MAWLHATPRPDARTKRAKIERAADDDVPKLNRLERMKKDGIRPEMPPNPLPHLVRWLSEIGMSEAAGMGVAPLSWREINEWQRATNIALAPWEARLIRRLSVEYIAEGRRAESENCPPPWRAPVTRREADVERERLRMVLG